MRGADVFIVGGGPAGIAAALAARRKGFRVDVADIARPPIDKACGEGLMPDGVAALDALGVSVDPLQCCAFGGIRFLESGTTVQADFPVGRGFGVRRTVLHAALVSAAEQAGVILHWGARVTGIADEGVIVDGERVPARWIVGADGGRSRVRGWAGLDAGKVGSQRFGFRVHYQLAPWSEYMELHWGNRGQVYVTPVSPQEVCVTLITRDRHLRLEEALGQFPAIQTRLAGAKPSSTLRGAVTLSCRLACVGRGNVALVGDASGSVDAITGECLCLAFRQAAALAEAIEGGDLERYREAHARLTRRPAFMAALLLELDRRPWLRNRVLRTLARKPEVFARMLAMHVGQLSLSGLAATGFHFACQMLTE